MVVVELPAGILTATADTGVIATASTLTVKPTEFPGHPGTTTETGHTVVAWIFRVPTVFAVAVTLAFPPASLVGVPMDGPLGKARKFV